MTSSPTRKIRVFVVDDSAVVRRLVTDALSHDSEIEVIGTASDPYDARDKLKVLEPDVMTLDIEMPKMDGLTFLKLVMDHRPMPVIILSSLSQQGSQTALEALRLGAVEVLGKPQGASSFGDLGPQLIEKIKAAAVAKLRPLPSTASHPSNEKGPPPSSGRPACRDPRALILLGASTGGTEALSEILTSLPDNLPPIAIVQHIPARFSLAFAQRLNSLCTLEVREAVDGDVLTPGLALIAPGNFHMMIHRVGDCYKVRIADGPMVWHQRPAVDLLFKSAAECGGPHVLAGLLTGMGKDGAEGLLRLREKKASTFAQDEASSIVYGMPRAAWENGAAQRQVPLDRVAAHIIRTVASFPANASAQTPP
jgi:two-component system chemotaxis response regulator CheB